MASGSFGEIDRIKNSYLTDFLFYLTYLIQKGEADEAEDKFQENLRKAKKRH